MLRFSEKFAFLVTSVMLYSVGAGSASADTLSGGSSSVGFAPSTWVLSCAAVSAVLGMYFRQRRLQPQQQSLAADYAACGKA